MNRDNVELLLAILLDTPDDGFDMSRWCGTPCCAAGNYIQRRGRKCSLVFAKEHGRPGNTVPEQVGTGRQSFSALAGEFEIGRDVAVWLFDPKEYPTCPDVTRAEVIDRVRLMLAQD